MTQKWIRRKVSKKKAWAVLSKLSRASDSYSSSQGVSNGGAETLLEAEQRTAESLQTHTRDGRRQQPILSSSSGEWQLAPRKSPETKQPEETRPQETGIISSGVTETPERKRKSNDQLRLRLDLNLDIEVQLKARIEGDITLQLL